MHCLFSLYFYISTYHVHQQLNAKTSALQPWRSTSTWRLTIQSQQIPDIKHQVVISVVHTQRTGWTEEKTVFLVGGKHNFMLPCLTHSAFNSSSVWAKFLTRERGAASPETVLQPWHHELPLLPVSNGFPPAAPAERCPSTPNPTQAQSSPKPFPHGHCIHLENKLQWGRLI